MLRPHIVILGAGFGGVYTARKLAPQVRAGKIDVTVVNRTNYFLFTPLLHEVATGALSPMSAAEPLREIFVGTGIELCQGVVESVNALDRRVTVLGNGARHTLPYDYLIIATGAETNYYGIPGADKFSLPLKNLADAARIRARIIDSFELALLAEDPAERSRLLSFAVVGGGATGVEAAAELAEFVSGITERYYNGTNSFSPEEPKVSLIHTGPELLQQFAPTLRAAAEKRLRRDGVSLHMNNMVTAVTAAGLALSNNTTIPAGTVVWAAGVKPVVPHFEGGQQPALALGGRLAVDEFFRVGGDERVFALGDVAGYVDTDALPRNGQPAALPLLAQVAQAESGTVAFNIIASLKGKKLRSFRYRSKGGMVSVGQWFAVGEIFSLNIAGRLAWWIWRTVYLFKFASWQKRIRIAFEWTFELFYPRDITKLT